MIVSDRQKPTQLRTDPRRAAERKVDGRQRVKQRKDESRHQNELVHAFAERTGCELVNEEDYMARHNAEQETTARIRRENLHHHALREYLAERSEGKNPCR